MQLRALGSSEDMAHSSLRFGIGRFSTEEEIDLVVQKIVGTVNWLREMRSVLSLPARCGPLADGRSLAPARSGSCIRKVSTCPRSTGLRTTERAEGPGEGAVSRGSMFITIDLLLHKEKKTLREG